MQINQVLYRDGRIQTERRPYHQQHKLQEVILKVRLTFTELFDNKTEVVRAHLKKNRCFVFIFTFKWYILFEI